MNPTCLYLVIPCYNEEAVLGETLCRVKAMMAEMERAGILSSESKILLVDDGSKDATWAIIKQAAKEDGAVCGVKLAKNVGHQNALLAGLMCAKDACDCAISMDADLQDDPHAIQDFVAEFRKGYDVVYGVRSTRKKDKKFKKITAHGFYKLMKALGADIVENHADYRLMSKAALNALAQFEEVNLFLRGVVRLVGFNSTVVYYERHPRFAGESKYPLKKMLSFALDGITSFSIKPIRLVWSFGLLVCFLAVLAAVYALVAHFAGNTVSGWASLMISIWFLGGVQLICVGVIGEYVGKIYKEVKRRPRYIIEEKTKKDE